MPPCSYISHFLFSSGNFIRQRLGTYHDNINNDTQEKKRPHNVLREQERRRIFHLISKYKSWRLFAQITGQKLLTCERKMVEMTLWQNKDGRRFVIVGVERGRGSDFYISFLCRAFTFVYVDVIVRKKKSLWITKVEIRQKISRTFVYKIVLSLCLFS